MLSGWLEGDQATWKALPTLAEEVRFVLIICDDGERCFDLGKLQSLTFEIVCVNIPVTLKESSGEIYYKDFKKLSLAR